MALRSLASASIVRPRASASRRASRATRSRLTRRRARGGGSHERWSFERHGPYYSGDSVDYSFDGDESYPLDPEPRAMPWDGFPPRPTTPPPGRPRRERGPAWTRDDDDDCVGSSDAGAAARGGEAAAWTRTSAHAAIPHVVSVKLPRPAARHVEVAPRRGSAARQYDAFGAEVPVQVRRPPRPRAKKSNDARVSKKTPRPRRPTSPSPNLPPTPPALPRRPGLRFLRRRAHGRGRRRRRAAPRPRARPRPARRRPRRPLRRVEDSDGPPRGRAAVRSHQASAGGAGGAAADASVRAVPEG